MSISYQVGVNGAARWLLYLHMRGHRRKKAPASLSGASLPVSCLAAETELRGDLNAKYPLLRGDRDLASRYKS